MEKFSWRLISLSTMLILCACSTLRWSDYRNMERDVEEKLIEDAYQDVQQTKASKAFVDDSEHIGLKQLHV